MNSTVRSLLVVAALAAVVFVVVFVGTYTSTRPPALLPGGTDPAGPADPAAGEPLKFLTKVSQWDPSDEAVVPDHEVGESITHTYPFWFVNENPVEVSVTPKSKSCTCAYVEVATLPQAVWADWKALTGEKLLGGGKLAPTSNAAAVEAFARLWAEVERAKWTRLDPNTSDTARVAAAAGGTPAVGVLRMAWHAKEPMEPKRLAAELITRAGSGPAAIARLEVSTVAAPWARAVPPTLDLGDIGPNGKKTASVLVFSTVRDKLDITPRIDPDDPCVTVGPPVSVPASEATQFVASAPNKVRVKSAVRVPVTVQESAAGRHLELGPLVHRLVLRSDAPSDLVVQLAGSVQGEVRLVSGADRGRIALGSFYAADGTSKTVMVQVDRPNARLTLAPEGQPENLELSLKTSPPEAGPNRYDLTVSVPPNRVSGELPADTFVTLVLEAGGEKKLVRLPVKGRAGAR